MDGVLFDSMPNHSYAWSKATSQYGLSITPEEVYMNEGRTGNGTINLLAQKFWGRDATKAEMQKIYETKSKFFNESPESHPMPGANDVLQWVKEQGMAIVLVTGSAQSSLLAKLNHHFPGFFRQDRMVTAFDVKIGKPHPEPFLIGLQKAGATAEETVVIENAPLGVEAAHRAGIYTIGVNTGPLNDQILLSSGADVVFSSMGQLYQQLKEGYLDHI